MHHVVLSARVDVYDYRTEDGNDTITIRVVMGVPGITAGYCTTHPPVTIAEITRKSQGTWRGDFGNNSAVFPTPARDFGFCPPEEAAGWLASFSASQLYGTKNALAAQRAELLRYLEDELARILNELEAVKPLTMPACPPELDAQEQPPA